MNQRAKFEHAALMNRDVFPTVETCAQDVLCEEVRLISQEALITDSKALLTPPSETALVPRVVPFYNVMNVKDMVMVLSTAKRSSSAITVNV